MGWGNNSLFSNLGLITKMATMYHPSNSFSQLSNNATTPESDISFSYPIATSWPTRPLPHRDPARRQDLSLRIVMLNCQSIRSSGKPAQLENMIPSLQADIIIGSESSRPPIQLLHRIYQFD